MAVTKSINVCFARDPTSAQRLMRLAAKRLKNQEVESRSGVNITEYDLIASNK